MDDIYFAGIAYAEDICLLALKQRDLELIVTECIAGFEATGLETGMNKTFWTSIVRSPTASLNVVRDNHKMSWRKSFYA